MVSKTLFLYNFHKKKVFFLDGYDNDYLFLDDDLFCVWIDEYLADCQEIEKLKEQAAGDEE